MIIENPGTFRKNVCNRLAQTVGGTNNTIIINLEKGVYNYAIREAKFRKIIKKWTNEPFVQLYIDRLRSIYINLKNPTIMQTIINGELAPQSFAFMTHQEMKPERWKSLIETKMKRDANKYVNNKQASTDMFTCRKCKSKRCTYYELQTRSADEPATIFVTCLDCGKNWKS